MTKRLLLADDSITIQKVIGITFANEDYELTVVDNGDAALEKVAAQKPDLVLADVYMPGKNGYEVCSAIKMNPALAGTPVLLLTGTFEPFDEGKARAAGADSWIAKPFESQALIERVEQLLSQTAKVSPAVRAPEASAAAPVSEPEPALATEEIPLEMGLEPWDIPAIPAAAEEGARETGASVAAVEEDPWGGISFDEQELPPAVPPEIAAIEPAITAEDDFALEEIADFPAENLPTESGIDHLDQEIPAKESPAPSAWDDLDEDILALDESNILEAEELTVDTEFIFAEEPPRLEEEEEFVFNEEAAPTTSSVGGRDTLEQGAVPAGEFTFADLEPAEEASEDLVFGEENIVPAEPADLSSGDAEAIPAATEDWEFSDDQDVPTVEDLLLDEPLAAEPAFAQEDAGFWTTAEEEPVSTPSTSESAAYAAVQPVEERIAALSEEDLERIVAKVAGTVVERLANTVLEKVAWEVVPDLAESLIREELRKIKEQAA